MDIGASAPLTRRNRSIGLDGAEPGYQLSLPALGQALWRSKPEIHESDQEMQYAAISSEGHLRQNSAKIGMTEIGRATQNGSAGRLIRTIKEQEVILSEYENYEDAYDWMGIFIEDVYHRGRIRSSLGHLAPIEYKYECKARLNSAMAVP
jgi:transposase InsO family protein